MNIDENLIREKLENLVDPDLNKTFKELGYIHEIQVRNGLIKIYLKIVQPIHWIAEEINRLCANALNEIASDLENEIIISELEQQDPGRTVLKGVKNIIAVASGKGGVGKSSIASNIASALSLNGAKVGILDGDVYGPSQPTMFGLTDSRLEVLEKEDGTVVALPTEKWGIKVASMGFIMNRDQAAIIRGPMLASYFSMLFEQLDWGLLDFLVFDLPPGTGDIQLTLTQKIPLTGAVIVTTPQEIALADVRRSIAMFKRVNVNILGIIENMSYFSPPDMPDKKYYIFGRGGGKLVAEETGVPLLGEVPLDIVMREGNDGGLPIVLRDDVSKQKQILIHITKNIVREIRKINQKMLSDYTLQIQI